MRGTKLFAGGLLFCLMSWCILLIAGCASPSGGEQSTASSSPGPVLTAIKDRSKQQTETFKKLVLPGKLAGPHLGEIYSRSASHHNGHRNPVIVIHGILGSRLTDRDSGYVAWGSFRVGKLHQDTSPLALPMRQCASLSSLADRHYADSILSQGELFVFGIPVHVDAYRGILDSMGVGGFHNDPGGRATLNSISYGEDHYTCFEFHYDWRRDNAENAARLGQFIRQKSEYVRAVREQRYGVYGEPVRFDIVAHSMGGLIARYYLRYGEQQLCDDGSVPPVTWAGAQNVETLIQVATPNAGSPHVVQDLVNGKRFAMCLPKYSATILGTMPSVYQLMPRPRHQAVVSESDCRPINLYDINVWERFQWGLLDPDQDGELQELLPCATTRQQRLAIARDHLSKSLSRAWQFHEALDRPADPPPGTSIYLFAGDSINTLAGLKVNPETGRVKVCRKVPGDGVVLRTSALMDERLTRGRWQPRLVSPIKWEHSTFVFAEHVAITSGPVFTDNVLNLLLEYPRDRPQMASNECQVPNAMELGSIDLEPIGIKPREAAPVELDAMELTPIELKPIAAPAVPFSTEPHSDHDIE